MRVIRWMVLAAGMLGGLFGVGLSAQSAPLPVSAAVADQVAASSGVEKAYYYYRRRFYRPRFYRRHYYRPRFYRRHYYRPRFYRRRFFYY